MLSPQISLPPVAMVNGGKSLLIAEPPCIIARVPTRANWCTRQFPLINARSCTMTCPASNCPPRDNDVVSDMAIMCDVTVLHEKVM